MKFFKKSKQLQLFIWMTILLLLWEGTAMAILISTSCRCQISKKYNPHFSEGACACCQNKETKRKKKLSCCQKEEKLPPKKQSCCSSSTSSMHKKILKNNMLLSACSCASKKVPVEGRAKKILPTFSPEEWKNLCSLFVANPSPSASTSFQISPICVHPGFSPPPLQILFTTVLRL